MKSTLYVCETYSAQKASILKVTYRSESGRIGFEVDNSAIDIFKFLLKNSATWDFKKDTIRKFDENIFVDPFAFLSNIRPVDRYTRLLVFSHARALDSNLVKQISNIAFDENELFMQKAITAVEQGYSLMLINLSDFSIDIFSSPQLLLAEKLKEKAKTLNIEFLLISEDELPVW